MHWLGWKNGKEWGKIFCPMLGDWVMTYWEEGTPAYDTYTAPFVIDGDVCFYRYDHDQGCWNEDLYILGDCSEDLNLRFK